MVVLLRFVVLLLLLTACQPVAMRDGQALKDLTVPAGAELYVIDPRASLLLVKVYKAGTLAKLGHNHVISSRDLQGEIYLTASPEQTALEIRLPVTTLDIDLPEMRRQAGAEFSGELDPQAISGTRENLLGAEQLDATNAPQIIMRSRQVSGADQSFVVTADLAFRTHINSITVPVQVEFSPQQINVSGAFRLAQTDFGLQPFSVMLGALQVQDELDIEFSIVAHRRP